MRRREFVTLVGGALVGGALAARAQQPRKLARVAFLATGAVESSDARATLEALKQGLREHGYIDGQSIIVEVRGADSQIERFTALASELVDLGPDVIVASNTPAARAVQQATRAIPIVVPVMGDPVGDGLVANLARPGGNITGLTFLGPQLVAKRLALLREAMPSVSRVAAIWHPGAYSEHTMTDMLKQAAEAAQSLGVNLKLFAVKGPADLEQTFSAIAGERYEALFVFPSPMFFTERQRIINLTTQPRLASVSMSSEFVKLGGLMSYGADINDSFRISAKYVDKILRGSKPADLPVEQPTKFDLWINLKTAKELGLSIPSTLLARADEVIE